MLKSKTKEIIRNFSISQAEVAPLMPSYDLPGNVAQDLRYSTSQKDFLEKIKQVTSYFSDFKPSQIVTPFQGTSLLMSKDMSRFYFGSREGRICVAKIENKEILQDIDLKEGTIRTLALFQNDTYLFSGGQGGAIRKFLIEDMSEVQTLTGHLSEVDVILISSKEEYMYSLGDEGTVYKWDLLSNSPKPTHLYSHNCQSYALDLSADDQFLASAGADKSVTIYSLILSSKIRVLSEEEFGTIWCVKITQTNKYIAFGDDAPNVYVYDFKTFKRIRKFVGHNQKVRCMTATLDENFIITGGNDNKIYMWDILRKTNGLVFNGHLNGVKALILSGDNKNLFSMSDDCSIKSWRIPRVDHYRELGIKIEESKIMKMILGKQNPNIIYILENTKLLGLDKANGLLAEIENFNIKYIACFAFGLQTDIIAIVSAFEETKIQHSELHQIDYTIFIYDFNNQKYLNTFYLKSYGIHSILISADEQFLIIGELYRCQIFHINNFQSYHIFRTHKFEVVSVTDSPNGAYLFSGDTSGLIKSYDFKKRYEIKPLAASDQRVVKMIVTPDNEYLIASHADFSTNIWAVSKMIKIHTMNQDKLLDIKFPRNSTVMFSLYETSIKGFLIPSLVSCFSIRLHGKASKFAFTASEYEIAVLMESSISMYINPLKCEHIMAYGELDYLNYFHQQIGRLVINKLNKHDSIMNYWIIEPFHINIMHLYAYLDKEELLKQCFEENVGCFMSKSGISPLDICLEMKFEKCIEVMYTGIKQLAFKNPLFLSILENSLVRLNRSLSATAFRFYKLAIYKTIDTRLPKFCVSTRNMPIIIFNPNVLAHKSSFMAYDDYSNNGKELNFTQTYFKVNMAPGSYESLDFVKSIAETENDSLLKSEFIQLVLSQKWKKISFIMYYQCAMYSLYLGLLSAYASYEMDILLIISFIANLFLVLEEISQIINSGLNYFKDYYNYIDLIRAGLMIFCYLDILQSSNHNNELLAVVLIVSWARGITYFRLFKGTRYYVNLIYEVVIDILPFLMILFYSTIAFGIIFRTIQHNDDSQFAYLKTSWEINVGGFTTTSYDAFMYTTFFFSTLFNPIIMLNLLISIMANTFQNVNAQSMVADKKELAGMILEAETTLFCNRRKNLKYYLHICSSKVKGAVREVGEIKRIKGKIAELKNGQANITNRLEEVDAKVKEIKESVKEMGEGIKLLLEANKIRRN